MSSGLLEEVSELRQPLLDVGRKLERDVLAGLRVKRREVVERSASGRDLMLLDPADDRPPVVRDLPLGRAIPEAVALRREESELELQGRASRFEKRPATLWGCPGAADQGMQPRGVWRDYARPLATV